MKRLQLRHGWSQFVIDLLFGVILLGPLVFGLVTGASETAIYISIGAGAGYALHMVQKVLLYEELLSEAVKEKAETEVKDKVEEEVNSGFGEKVEEQVEETLAATGDE